MEQNKATVVVIDDNRLTLSWLEKCLRDLYECVTFQNGNQALDYMVTHPADLLLLDIDMPIINGYDVITIMKRNKILKHIPVVFLTCMGDPDSQRKGIGLGAVDFLIKPVGDNILQHCASLHLSKHETRELYYFYSLDVNGNFIDCNEKFIWFMGLNEIGEVLMKNISDFVMTPVGGYIVDAINKASKGEIVNERLFIQGIEIDRHIVPVYYDDDRIVGYKEVAYKV